MAEGLGMGLKIFLILMPAIISVMALPFLQPRANESSSDVIPAGKDGWVSLFEGESIHGWEIIDSGTWEVSSGILRGTAGKVLNRWCWVDFELQTKYRGSGSLLLRVGSDQTGHIGFEQPGYEYDLKSHEFRKVAGDTLARGNFNGNADQWHTLSLSVSDGKFRVVLDGDQSIESVDMSSPLKGRIGFASDGNSLEIQYLRIRSLSGSESRNIPAENYYCYVCHANFEYDDPLVGVHEEADVLCSDCHGSSLEHRSDEDNVVPPDIIYRRPQVDRMCLECHERHEDQSHPSGEEILNGVCTDCHGNHQVP
jgi:hypothetical protein